MNVKGNKDTFQFNNLVWLHCDLQLRGKVIVRHGKRKEVASGDKWVFCPQQHFPRDRMSIKTCEKCPHFKEYSTIEDNNGQVTSKPAGKTWIWEQAEKKEEQKKDKITITDKDLEEVEEEQRKWKDEEEEL